MNIINITERKICVLENDIIVLGEGVDCERAADLAAAQYRPCILIGAGDKYAETKYSPLYLECYNRDHIAEYVNDCSYVAQLNE